MTKCMYTLLQWANRYDQPTLHPMPICSTHTPTQGSATDPECLLESRGQKRNLSDSTKSNQMISYKIQYRASAERHKQVEPGTKEPLPHKGTSSSE